jgi:hypothetical protein
MDGEPGRIGAWLARRSSRRGFFKFAAGSALSVGVFLTGNRTERPLLPC